MRYGYMPIMVSLFELMLIAWNTIELSNDVPSQSGESKGSLQNDFDMICLKKINGFQMWNDYQCKVKIDSE